MNENRKKYNLRLCSPSDNAGLADCWIEISSRPPWQLYFHSVILGDLPVEEIDLFEGLKRLRLWLENQGWFLCCNGARVDAYPSPLSLEMLGGRKVYITELGQQARRSQLVETFEPADCALVSTVNDQEEYHKSWIISLE